MMLQHSTFCAIPIPSSQSQLPYLFSQSLNQRNNPLLQHQQHFTFLSSKKPKPSTFRISSLAPNSFDEIAQIAHNKVLIAASASALVGQLFKPFASVLLYGKEFDIRAIFQAGGFPSTHSSATVASATLLGLERGFADPIFGLTFVYAGLIMYDAQGVRREVGIHARTLNKLLLQLQVNSLLSKERDGSINSQPGKPKQFKVGGLEKSLLSQEEPQQANANLLVKSESKTRLTERDAEEISKLAANGFLPLKESIGHTEVEVIAGALLGVLVGFAVYNFM